MAIFRNLKMLGLGASLLIASPMAMAFPLTSISLAQSALMLFPLLLAPSCHPNSRKGWLGLSFALLSLSLVLGYNSMLSNSIRLASSEHEYKQAQSHRFDKRSLLTVDEAITAMQSSSSFVAHVTDNPNPSLPGAFMYNLGDKDKLVNDFNSGNYDKVILTSEYSYTASLYKSYLERQIDAPIYFSKLHYNDHALWIRSRNPSLSTNAHWHLPRNTQLRHADQLKLINYITVSVDKLFENDYYGNGPILQKKRITSMSEQEWLAIKERIDESKPTVIFFPDIFNSDSSINDDLKVISKFVAYKLGIDSIEFTTERLYAHNPKHYDNTHTSWIPNGSKVISAPKLYNLLGDHKGKVTAICFSEFCRHVFPIGETINAYDNEFIKFNHGFTFDLKQLEQLKHQPIVITPHDAQSLNIAYHLAEALFLEGYDFKGLTEAPALLFGATNIHDNQVVPDETLIQIHMDLLSIGKLMTPDHPVITEFVVFVCLSLGLGVALALSKRVVWLNLAINLVAVFLFINLDSIVLLSTQYYMSQVIEPIFVSAIFALFALAQFRKIWISGLIGCLIYLLWGQIPPVSDLFVLLTFAPQLLLAMASALTFKKITQSPLGDKANMTLPFTSHSMKGAIITPSTKYTHRLLLPGKDYILRSNHITYKEQEMAGIYESYTVNRDNIKAITCLAVNECRKSLNDDQIQFWLQPKLNYANFGVMSSHHDTNFLCASYSIDSSDNVTNGASSPYKAIDRFNPSNKLEASLLKTLSKIESYYQKAVIVEFGVSRLGKILVLQVRPNIFSLGEDTKLSHKWINTLSGPDSRRIIKVSQPSLTRFGQSIAAHVFNWNVYADNQSLYALKGLSSCPPCLYSIEYAFTQLKQIHSNLDSYLSTISLVMEMKALLSPMVDAYLSIDAMDASTRMSETLSCMMRDYMREEGLVLENDFDAGSQFIDVKGQPLKHVNFVLRDAYHDLFSLAFGIIAKKARSTQRTEFSGVSLHDYEKGKTGTHQSQENTGGQYDVVVNGYFSNDTVSMSEFMIRDDKQGLHIIADTIPSACISDSMLASSITLRHGSRLSHISLSAKAQNVPLRILV